MIVNITYKTTVKKVQQKFNAAYPFLKVEFGTNKKAAGERISKRHFFHSDICLLDVAEKPEPGWVVMHHWHTVQNIKEAFRQRFGLHAQFFRRENDQWIEILGTDDFTLQEQCELGRDIFEKHHEVFRTERELLL